MKSKFRVRRSTELNWGPWLDLDTAQEAVRLQFMADGFRGGNQRYVVENDLGHVAEYVCVESVPGQIKVGPSVQSQKTARNRKIISTSILDPEEGFRDPRIVALCDDGTVWYTIGRIHGGWTQAPEIPSGFTFRDEET